VANKAERHWILMASGFQHHWRNNDQATRAAAAHEPSSIQWRSRVRHHFKLGNELEARRSPSCFVFGTEAFFLYIFVLHTCVKLSTPTRKSKHPGGKNQRTRARRMTKVEEGGKQSNYSLLKKRSDRLGNRTQLGALLYGHGWFKRRKKSNETPSTWLVVVGTHTTNQHTHAHGRAAPLQLLPPQTPK